MHPPNNKPNTEDVRKLHNEINQIVNQRYLLSTAAVTLFGVIVAWTIPKDGSTIESELLPRIFVVTGLLNAILLLLFFISNFLRQILRTYATYLELTETSQWETHWRQFRSKHYFGYTKTQAVLFLVLGVFALLVPFIFATVGGAELKCSPGLVFTCISSILYLTLIAGMGFGDWFYSNLEDQIAARWKEVLGAAFQKQSSESSASRSSNETGT